MNQKTLKILGSVLFFIIICLFCIMILYLFNKDKLKSECLNKIAEDYCKERGWVSLGINIGNTFFKCGENERVIWADGYSYNFLNKEKKECEK